MLKDWWRTWKSSNRGPEICRCSSHPQYLFSSPFYCNNRTRTIRPYVHTSIRLMPSDYFISYDLYGFIFHIFPAHVHCNISHSFAMTNSADSFAVVEYFANIFFLSKIVILEVPAKCQKQISIHFILAVSNIDQAKWFIIMLLNKFSNFELNFYVVV